MSSVLHGMAAGLPSCKPPPGHLPDPDFLHPARGVERGEAVQPDTTDQHREQRPHGGDLQIADRRPGHTRFEATLG